MTITTDTLPDGKVGEAYSQILTATGTTPITWSIDGGNLPASLSLNKDTGEISGTPTAEGTSTFTVKATNSAGSDTKELSITIEAVDPVELDPVPYLDADGKRQVCTEYTVLKSNTTNSILDLENKWYELPAGWYVVEGDVTITPRVDTQGEVNLILKDGSHLTAEWGINVKKGDTFTVYAQSTGEDTMGKLTACLPEDFNSDGSVDYVVWPDEGLSGIGGGVRWKKANNGIYESEGTIVINGGNIRARGQNRASAIGGTFQDHADVASSGYSSEKRLGGSITINGGIVRTEAITSGTAITAFKRGNWQLLFRVWRQCYHQRRHGHCQCRQQRDLHRAGRQHHHQRRYDNGDRRHQQLYGSERMPSYLETGSGRIGPGRSPSTAAR